MATSPGIGRGVRTLAASTLVFESLVFALAIPVAVAVYDVPGRTAGFVGGGLALACILVAGSLARPWAIPTGWLIQGAAIAAGFVVPVMFALGLVFGLLWWGALRIGRKTDALRIEFDAEIARREAELQNLDGEEAEGDGPHPPSEQDPDRGDGGR